MVVSRDRPLSSAAEVDTVRLVTNEKPMANNQGFPLTTLRNEIEWPMSEWANCSSPSSDSPALDPPRHIRNKRGGSGAGVGDERQETSAGIGYRRARTGAIL